MVALCLQSQHSETEARRSLHGSFLRGREEIKKGGREGVVIRQERGLGGWSQGAPQWVRDRDTMQSVVSGEFYLVGGEKRERVGGRAACYCVIRGERESM